MQYKEAKKLFRSEQKRAQREYELQQMTDLVKSSEIDHSYFWVLVNKSRKGSQHRVRPIKLENDTVITDPDEIRESWRSYFETLYSPKCSNVYDEDFKLHVENSLQDIITESFEQDKKILQHPFTVSEILDVAMSLKNKKAPGFDEVTAEHIKYGGDKLLSILTALYNSISEHESVPDNMKRGVIIPIPKGAKDASIRNNNRGITLIPIIGKIYEKLLLARHLGWADKNDRLDDLQGAAQPRASSIHTAWLLRETVATNVEKDSSIFVALLDTSKAFDTVWVDGLFYKLANAMDGKLWRILRDFYQEFKCCVLIGGIQSSWFVARQGVHQGAPWSMYLYTKMNNGLLTKLKESHMGARIGTIPSSNPAYADDIAIIAIHKRLLQKLLNIAYQYSLQWRFDFNASKTEIIRFGNDLCPSTELRLGDQQIVVKNGGIHMGIPLTLDGVFEANCVQDRIDSAHRAYYSIQGLGNKYSPVTPLVASKLYWAICVPRLIYGLEIACLSATNTRKIECSHGSMAKAIQGLPSQTSNAACLAPLGWCSLESHLDKLKLLFLWRILLMSTQCIYKQVAISKLCFYIYECTDDNKCWGPLWDILQTFKKYDILDILLDALTSGTYMSIFEFKNLVKGKVLHSENQRFNIACHMYKTLSLYNQCVTRIECWTWWVFAYHRPDKIKSCRILAQLLFGESCLKEHTARFKGNHFSKSCQNCNSYQTESVSHLLFMCSNQQLSAQRDKSWQRVSDVIPMALNDSFQHMTDELRTVFILSGMRCTYVKEWEIIYEQLADFVYNMYKEHSLIEEC
jgi:hypothetical protein